MTYGFKATSFIFPNFRSFAYFLRIKWLKRIFWWPASACSPGLHCRTDAVIPYSNEMGKGCFLLVEFVCDASWGIWWLPNFSEFSPIGNACIIYSTLYYYYTARPIWTNERSKRGIPHKDVPLWGLNDDSLNFESHPQKLKFWAHE